jgi:ABC-type molybdate transport system substrate-binding protein
VRLVQASPDAAAIGKITRATLQTAGQWESLDKATTAYRSTVNDVANDLTVGAADAGIVYDAVLHAYPKLEAVRIPELESAVSPVAIGVIATSQQPAAALHFARYVAAGDRGLRHYAEHGFLQVSKGDEWSDVPELSLFAGSMLRPAIEGTIVAFEQREGVRVSRVYNGCGSLVAQMKAGQHPDAYFACDREFMNQVPDLFPGPVDVSENELVILVQKGNPQNIADLKDLGRKRLRVGIGHEKQCAMGWLTQKTLKEGGVQTEVMENVTVQTPTGDMLVNQLLTGSLDAAVVYLSNAAGARGKLDAVRIQGLECSVATQPFAVSKDTRYPQLTARLFDRLCSAESSDSFKAEGFQWLVK